MDKNKNKKYVLCLDKTHKYSNSKAINFDGNIYDNELEISENTYESIKLPIKIVDGNFVEIDIEEMPIVEPIEVEKSPMELLQEENKILRIQVQAMTENQTFLEDCIIELAQEVYK